MDMHLSYKKIMFDFAWVRIDGELKFRSEYLSQFMLARYRHR